MDHAHMARPATQRSGRGGGVRGGGVRRRGRVLASPLVVLGAALGMALGVLPHQGLPPAHGDENMGICIPAPVTPVLPPAGAGPQHATPLGAAFVFDPACGDPFGRHEAAPSWAQYNSTGTPNSVEHVATGSYAVRFSGLGGSAGVPQVTAVGAAAVRCRIGGWQADGFDELLTVLCADSAGTAVDWEFTASYTSERSAFSTFGYARADQPSSALGYQPTLQYMSSGGKVSVQRTAVGRYTVTRAEAGASPGADLVTAYGVTDGRTACKVAASSAAAVNVACFVGNVAADAPFTLTYGARGNLLGVPDASQGLGGLSSGYAWADTAAGAVPDPARRFASADPGSGWSQVFDQASHTAKVAMPVAMGAGIPQAVATGTDASFCSVAGDWSGGSIPVACWSGLGQPLQAPADVVFTGNH